MNAIRFDTRTGLPRLRAFVGDFADALTKPVSVRATLLRQLVAADDWLPDTYAAPHPEHYQQYLLHCDSTARFSVVSFVWGPGQRTPIHDHRVWGMVGVLRGAELVQQWQRSEGGFVEVGPARRLGRGEVDIFGPEIGDIHSVANAYSDRASISIHVYGANIGAVRRATYDETGAERPFTSGYANNQLPNLWNQNFT